MLQWMRSGPPGEDGARFAGVVADGDHIIELSPMNSFRCFDRWPPTSIPRSAISADGERMDPRDLGAGARGLVPVAAELAENRLRHLRAGAVVGAEEEDPQGKYAGHDRQSISRPPEAQGCQAA